MLATCVDLKIAVPAKSRSLHTILCRRDPRRTAIWPHIILYVRTAILPGPRFCVLGIRLQNRGPTVTVKIAVLARSRSSPLVGIIVHTIGGGGPRFGEPSVAKSRSDFHVKIAVLTYKLHTKLSIYIILYVRTAILPGPRFCNQHMYPY